MPTDLPRLLPPDDGGHAHRSTKAMVRERVTQCVDLLLSGAGFRDLVRYAQQKGWGVSKHAVRRYEKLAYQWIEQNSEEDRRRCFTLAMNQRRRLFFAAMQQQDLHLAHQILVDIDKLRGTYVYGAKIAEKEAELWKPPDLEKNAELEALLVRLRAALEARRARKAAEQAGQTPPPPMPEKPLHE